MSVWFSADFHLGHANIIGYCHRPFASAAEMDAVILDKLNAAVGADDTLYFLGDFCMGVPSAQYLEAAAAYRAGIRCRQVHLVWGNHDRRNVPGFAELFQSTHDLWEVPLASRLFVLCHYAMRVWNKSHTGKSCQLYGHDHGRLPELPHALTFDVGVDCWDFHPLSLEQVNEILEHRRAGGRAADLTVRDGRLVRR
jgi:calcineurin-like phosphoesterase family protein